MLRQGASPGDAQDIGLLVAELVEQVTHQGRQCGQVVRNYRWLGPADARHVEPDDFSLGVERMDERLQQLEARPDAVAQHKWRPLGVPASHRDPQAPTTGHQRATGRTRRRADGQGAQRARPPALSGSAGLERFGGHRLGGRRWLRMPVRVVARPSRSGRPVGPTFIVCLFPERISLLGGCASTSSARPAADAIRTSGGSPAAASPATGRGRREGYSACPFTTNGPSIGHK